MTTTDKNKLIAEFMGLSYCTKHMYEGWYKNHEHNHRVCDFDGLKYHSSWDWLMPVVEKISMINHGSNDGQRYIFNTNRCAKFHINENDKPIKIRIKGVHITYPTPFIEINSFDELEGTWLACVEFIKWYSCQKEK